MFDKCVVIVNVSELAMKRIMPKKRETKVMYKENNFWILVYLKDRESKINYFVMSQHSYLLIVDKIRKIKNEEA